MLMLSRCVEYHEVWMARRRPCCAQRRVPSGSSSMNAWWNCCIRPVSLSISASAS